MDKVSRNELLTRIEDVLSYLLSKKYDANIKIHLKKEQITNDDIIESRTIAKK